MGSPPTISAVGLRKSYKSVAALDGFDLQVPAGTIHGLLGPNGAGKSTAIKALTTLVELDEGEARIDGHDVRREARTVRKRIGLVGQNHAVDEILGGKQNLVMFARLGGLDARAARKRADELLERFDLTAAAGKPVSGYSGGMRRRLDIAVSLLLDPAVLFLDEPTTGLDPRGRNEVWLAVREISARGTTVLLTTQYLDEADQLASRISVMNAGRVIAEGSPVELKRRFGGDRIVATPEHRDSDLAAVLASALGAEPELEEESGAVTVPAESGTASLAVALRAIDEAGIPLVDLELRRPTLDDVFLSLTEKKETR